MSGNELSKTGYAVLGLLAVRPWSAYELTRQVERGLHWFWPRSGNTLYELPKKLVLAGLARSGTHLTGRRPRTEFRITPAGRRALRDWLKEPSKPPVLEVEALVRVLFADHGSREDLLTTLRQFYEQVEDLQDVGRAIGAEYAGSGGGPFPDRLHVNALIFEFMWRYSEALREWAEWAIDEVNRWDGVGDQRHRREQLLARYAEVARSTRAHDHDSRL